MNKSKKIKLTQGYYALVDEEDYVLLKEYKWQVRTDKSNYYATGVYKEKRVQMHRIIMKAKKGEIIDHINGNGLDNRKINLRVVSARINAWNRKNNAKYPGVHWHSQKQKWYASIHLNYQTRSLGFFDTEIEAAREYYNNLPLEDKEFYKKNFLESNEKE